MTRRSTAHHVARALPFAALAVSVLALSGPSRADEADDCDAAFGQGQRMRHDNLLVEARRQFARCAQVSCPTGIQNDCVQAAKEVSDEIPLVIFDVKGPNGNDMVNVRVALDGNPLTDWLIGRAYELEPGPHSFSFDAEGMVHVDRRVVVSPREKSKRVEVTFQSNAPVPPPPPPVTTTPAYVPPPPPMPIYTAPVSRPSRAPGIVLITLGSVGIAVGAVFGALALGTKANLDLACTPNPSGSGKLCPSSSQSDIDSLSTQSLVSTIGITAGAIGLGAGIILLATSSRAPAPAVGKVRARPFIGLGSMGLKGEF